jgi:uncharacterized membrane protein
VDNAAGIDLVGYEGLAILLGVVAGLALYGWRWARLQKADNAATGEKPEGESRAA